MAQKQTERYIDVLQPVVNFYNRTWHSGIRSEPINVNKKNEKKLWWQMYWPDIKKMKKEANRRKKSKFAYKVGDKVRISQTRNLLSKRV